MVKVFAVSSCLSPISVFPIFPCRKMLLSCRVLRRGVMQDATVVVGHFGSVGKDVNDFCTEVSVHQSLAAIFPIFAILARPLI